MAHLRQYQRRTRADGGRAVGTLSCPHCPSTTADERGRPAGSYDDFPDQTPAQPDETFHCPRCEETVTPDRG